MAKKPQAADEQPAVVKVRLLVDHYSGPAGSLAQLDAETAAALVAAGSADDHPDAVAYAESLKAEAR